MRPLILPRTPQTPSVATNSADVWGFLATPFQSKEDPTHGDSAYDQLRELLFSGIPQTGVRHQDEAKPVPEADRGVGNSKYPRSEHIQKRRRFCNGQSQCGECRGCTGDFGQLNSLDWHCHGSEPNAPSGCATGAPGATRAESH